MLHGQPASLPCRKYSLERVLYSYHAGAVKAPLLAPAACCQGLPSHRPGQFHNVRCDAIVGGKRVTRNNRRRLKSNIAAGEVLAGPDLLYGSYDEELFEPSHDLRELASAQLRSMFQVLDRLSKAAPQQPTAGSSCRACVYARRAESLGSTQIRLQRVACWPPRITQPPAGAWSSIHGSDDSQQPGGGSNSANYDEMDDMCIMDDVFAEASLCQEELLLLPNSNMVVLPLAEAGILVGLLVVTLDPSHGSSSSAAEAGSPWDRFASSTSQMNLAEDTVWCLRMAVPPLAKACAMDLRSALAGAQQEAQQRLARSLLLEARGPLQVLGTFGQMLAPRLRAERNGQPESDMADGMVLQGQRLADVVAQLEAALRPLAGVRGSNVRQQLALPAATADAGSLAVGSFSYSSSRAMDSFDDVEDADVTADLWHSDRQLLSQPHPQQALHQQQVLVGPAAKVQQQVSQGHSKAGLLPEHISSDDSVRDNVAAHTTPAMSGSSYQQEQQVLPHLPGQGTAGVIVSSSRDIRWSNVQADTLVKSVRASSSSSSTSSGHSSTCSASYSAPAGGFDMQRTIDMEPVDSRTTPDTSFDMDSVNTRTSSTVIAPKQAAIGDANLSISNSGSTGWDRPQKVAMSNSSNSKVRQPRQLQQQQPAHCNLIETVSHLLTAAARLAKEEGKNFIVNSPLQLDHPVPATHPPSNSSSSSGYMLLPRPIRPLLVGLAASTCRRVLGYVLDVALQCTPRGGQLCVTARESSGGVEVSLMHTGQVQVSRLHTTSKALASVVHGGSGPGISSSISSAQAGISVLAAKDPATGGMREGSRGAGSSRRLQDLASSGSLRSSSSSLVSLDFASQVLQEIGGRLAVVYPCHFMNAVTGNLDVGSSIEVWLPPPAPGSTG